ncbi:hypothetical protein DPEC_G00163830 [Dallia pectoralis]|uniref:Uncharacterized protein n=1 Tax=Dallia pectoralis TaxID=75939 RepID=A0ACC2GHA6_DALPE|nr:hypothetical protein DPEC_G00163830 [Dallia pectoralis]
MQLSEELGSTQLTAKRLHLWRIQNQMTLKASHDAVMIKMDELTVQLKEEQLRSLDLERQLQANSFSQRRTEELQERIVDLEKERQLLKKNCDKLVNSVFEVSQEQKVESSS